MKEIKMSNVYPVKRLSRSIGGGDGINKVNKHLNIMGIREVMIGTLLHRIGEVASIEEFTNWLAFTGAGTLPASEIELVVSDFVDYTKELDAEVER